MAASLNPDIRRLHVYSGREFEALREMVMSNCSRSEAKAHAFLGTIIREGIKHAHLIPSIISWFKSAFKKRETQPKPLRARAMQQGRRTCRPQFDLLPKRGVYFFVEAPTIVAKEEQFMEPEHFSPNAIIAPIVAAHVPVAAEVLQFVSSEHREVMLESPFTHEPMAGLHFDERGSCSYLATSIADPDKVVCTTLIPDENGDYEVTEVIGDLVKANDGENCFDVENTEAFPEGLVSTTALAIMNMASKGASMMASHGREAIIASEMDFFIDEMVANDESAMAHASARFNFLTTPVQPTTDEE